MFSRAALRRNLGDGNRLSIPHRALGQVSNRADAEAIVALYKSMPPIMLCPDRADNMQVCVCVLPAATS